MSILNWIQTNESIISLAATITLVIITGIYVYFTKRILDSTIRQSNLVPNPVVGIRLGRMDIFKIPEFSSHNLNIGLDLINIGNAPAIDVLVDAEIILKYSNIKGEKVIPSRFEPSFISFIRPGEEISESPSHNAVFGDSRRR